MADYTTHDLVPSFYCKPPSGKIQESSGISWKEAEAERNHLLQVFGRVMMVEGHKPPLKVTQVYRFLKKEYNIKLTGAGKYQKLKQLMYLIERNQHKEFDLRVALSAYDYKG